MFRRVLLTLALSFLGACAHLTGATPAAAQATGTASAESAHALLGRLVGRWELTGTIAGQSVVHDVEAAPVLQGNYVRLEEVSRERDSGGQPQYEATIFIGWLESARHYVCLWLDNTEVASGEITCTAPANELDAIPFEFRNRNGTLDIATTFTYRRADDTWEWRIDNVSDGRRTPFARLIMRRR